MRSKIRKRKGQLRRWGGAGVRKKAAARGAGICTDIESYRRRGLDPHAYLKDVLTRLPKMTNWQIPEITPEVWAKARL
jgi:hypothetical protein